MSSRGAFVQTTLSMVEYGDKNMKRENLIRIGTLATVPAMAALIYSLVKPTDAYFFTAIVVALVVAWVLEAVLLAWHRKTKTS
jgi:hypothetical protein